MKWERDVPECPAGRSALRARVVSALAETAHGFPSPAILFQLTIITIFITFLFKKMNTR